MSFERALALHRSGELDKAEKKYRDYLSNKNSSDPLALNLLGVLLYQKSNHHEALALIRRAIDHKPHYPQAYCNLGVVFEALDQYEDAKRCFESAVEQKPDYWLALFNLGNVFHKLKQFTNAIACFRETISYKEDYPEAYMNCGLALVELKEFQGALDNYDKALELQPDYAEALNNKGNLFTLQKLYTESLVCLDKALAIDPSYAKAHFNRGNALNALKMPLQAKESLLQATILDRQFVDAFCNLGVTFLSLRQFENAIKSLTQALAIDSQNVNSHFNLAQAYKEIKEFGASNHHLEKVLEIDPLTSLDCIGPRVLNNLQSCKWDSLPMDVDLLMRRVQEHHKTTELLPLLAVSDDPFFLKSAGSLYCEENYPSDDNFFREPINAQGRRLVVGYFSSDFCAHPVAFLTSEIFELHDKLKFEVHAFMLGSQNDAYSERIRSSADHYWECYSMGHHDLLSLARQCKLDVAIDLNGATGGYRMELFAARVAPVQINYLGFPGSMGSTFHDYIIADSFLIPEGYEAAYSEKILYLPCFQANDRKRSASNKSPSREHFGLPNSAFVFCCFNNSYKISPSQFACWMRILSKVEGSVLWLTSNTPDVEKSLLQAAVKHGVQTHRIVFVKRLPYPEYLASYRCADLFLDTFPFNAGTTASDALWAGLPVLTMSGRSFASRMAGSLLHAVGLPELVTTNLHDYQTLAVGLANDAVKLKEIRSRLKSKSNTLFDSPLFVRSLENELTKLISQKIHTL